MRVTLLPLAFSATAEGTKQSDLYITWLIESEFNEGFASGAGIPMDFTY